MKYVSYYTPCVLKKQAKNFGFLYFNDENRKFLIKNRCLDIYLYLYDGANEETLTLDLFLGKEAL